MWHDVVDLGAFYASRPGLVAQRMIRRQIRALWPDTRGQSVLGLGFATPYLRPFRDEAERVVAVMPASQGVMPWPRNERRLVGLADEAALPLADESIDRALLVHAVECSEQLRPMLREVWRVLKSGGRLLVVAPNRRGIWARLERTPFGHGYSFSTAQLTQLMRECMFSPLNATTALYVPPSSSGLMLRLAGAWEGLGERWSLPFAGVVLVEAGKQVYAAKAARPTKGARAYRAFIGGPQPAHRQPLGAAPLAAEQPAGRHTPSTASTRPARA